MHRHFWLVLTLVLIWPIFCRAADPTFSEAIGLLSQERSYAESGAAIVKRYAPNDIETRRLYADAKGAFDSLIEQLLPTWPRTVIQGFRRSSASGLMLRYSSASPSA